MPFTGDGVGKPLGLLAEAGGAKIGVTAAQKDDVSFDEIFKLYYALGYLYEHRDEAGHHQLMLTLRSLLFAVREGVF